MRSGLTLCYSNPCREIADMHSSIRSEIPEGLQDTLCGRGECRTRTSDAPPTYTVGGGPSPFTRFDHGEDPRPYQPSKRPPALRSGYPALPR